MLMLSASPASAIGITLSTGQGLPGTRVTLTIGSIAAPCDVFFDTIHILGHGECQPGQPITTDFVIPAGTGAGLHTFRAVEAGSETSVTFTVLSRNRPQPPPPPPPPPPPAARPPAAAPRPPAAPQPPPPPAPTAPASPTPGPTDASPTPEAPVPSPTATAAGCLQPTSVESLTVTPDSGAAGSTATVAIVWSPTASTECAGEQAVVRVNGEPAGDPLTPVASEARIEVDIPEDVSGDIPVSLVSTGPSVRVLATAQFAVDEDGDGGVSSWLLVAAGVVATLAAVASQRLYSRRRARYGRR